jgi:hypothetical protein
LTLRRIKQNTLSSEDAGKKDGAYSILTGRMTLKVDSPKRGALFMIWQK